MYPKILVIFLTTLIVSKNDSPLKRIRTTEWGKMGDSNLRVGNPVIPENK